MATARNRATRRAIAAAVAGGFVLVLAAAGVRAGGLELTPFVGMDFIHTDNIELAPAGEAEDESVIRVAAGLKLKAKGPRLDANLQYELESYSYARDSARNEFFHRLQGAGKLTLMPDNFYIAGTAAIGQTVIDPKARVPLSNLAAVANRTDTFTATVNPYYEHRFAGDLEAHVGYTYGQIHYQKSNLNGAPLSDLNYRAIDGSFGREAEQDQFGIALVYNRQEVGYDLATKYAYEIAGARAQYKLTPNFVLTARGGRESNVSSDQVSAALNATFWSVGFIWHPSRTQELTVTAGERFFGKSYGLQYNFNGRRIRAGVAYDEGPTTQGIDAFKLPVFGGGADQVNPELTPITSDVFVSKIGRLWAEGTGRRNTVVVQLYDNRRAYLASNDDEDERGVSGQWTYLVGPRTKAYVAMQRYTLGYRASVREDYFTTYSLGMSRQIARHFSLHGSVQRWQRTSNDRTPSLGFLFYTENAVTIGGRYEF